MHTTQRTHVPVIVQLWLFAFYETNPIHV